MTSPIMESFIDNQKSGCHKAFELMSKGEIPMGCIDPSWPVWKIIDTLKSFGYIFNGVKWTMVFAIRTRINDMDERILKFYADTFEEALRALVDFYIFEGYISTLDYIEFFDEQTQEWIGV